MAGLYIHIPFCRTRCIYCAFYSTTALDRRQRYVDALCREMEMRVKELTQPLRTIYLGGGTPSQLSPTHLTQLFAALDKTGLASGQSPSEVTIECNPDDVSAGYAATLLQLGVNRVSMGAQTFDEARLRFLHRRHSAAQVHEAVDVLRQAGFRNISIDLMYGFPGETLADWQADIDHALSLGVEHISAYCLTVEEGTPLYALMQKATPSDSPCLGGEHDAAKTSPKQGRKEESAEELERQMYYTLVDRLAAAGYEHYEISNFCQSGFRSRHNSSYWNDTPYIGLGAAAHSYGPVTDAPAGSPQPVCRSWNVSDIGHYMAAIERGELPAEREVLDADTHYNDRIATALRTAEGLDLSTLSEQHRRHCLHEAAPFLSDGLLKLTPLQATPEVPNTPVQPDLQAPQSPLRLALTRRGLFVSDMVMSSLMLV